MEKVPHVKNLSKNYKLVISTGTPGKTVEILPVVNFVRNDDPKKKAMLTPCGVRGAANIVAKMIERSKSFKLSQAP